MSRPNDPVDFDTSVTGIAALGEPVRRALYQYVVAEGVPVNREQAATGTGVARHVAKFHLDKLVDDGLLEVEYARPPGRGGPGAGRPAKFYRRAARDVAVSLPPRDYELAGRLLARAIEAAEREHVPLRDALRRGAAEVGTNLGDQAHDREDARRPDAAHQAAEVLEQCGYEPRADGDGLILKNCPFHALAQDHTDLICAMNLDLVNGLLEALGPSGLEAILDRAPERCCVRLVQATGRS